MVFLAVFYVKRKYNEIIIRYEEDSRKRRVCLKNEQNAARYDQYSQNAEIQRGLGPPRFLHRL